MAWRVENGGHRSITEWHPKRQADTLAIMLSSENHRVLSSVTGKQIVVVPAAGMIRDGSVLFTC